MEKLKYEIDINASVDKVYQTMLSKETYRLWTAEFNPTSDFEGSWEKGSKIYFIGFNDEGKKEGMVSEIAENITNEFVSIHHIGYLDGENEITEIDGKPVFENAYENYYFSENEGITNVKVELDMNDEYIDYFNEAYPKALRKLKEIAE